MLLWSFSDKKQVIKLPEWQHVINPLTKEGGRDSLLVLVCKPTGMSSRIMINSNLIFTARHAILYYYDHPEPRKRGCLIHWYNFLIQSTLNFLCVYMIK